MAFSCRLYGLRKLQVLRTASLADVALTTSLRLLYYLVESGKILEFLADWRDLLGDSYCDFADFFRVKDEHTCYFAADEVCNNRVRIVVCAILETHAVLLRRSDNWCVNFSGFVKRVSPDTLLVETYDVCEPTSDEA